MQEYLTFQNFFTDRTLFQNVRLLPQGCTLVDSAGARADARAGRATGTIDFQEPEGKFNEAEALDELDRLFRQAVQRQLISDVDVGSYLSGGMDSGSITALAARELPFMRTFTVGFDLSSASGVELGYDERTRPRHVLPVQDRTL